MTTSFYINPNISLREGLKGYDKVKKGTILQIIVNDESNFIRLEKPFQGFVIDENYKIR